MTPVANCFLCTQTTLHSALPVRRGPGLLLLSSIIALGACAALPLTAHAADGTFDKTLQVKGPVLLGVDTESGNIHVSAGPVNSVHIIGHVHSSHSWMGSDTASGKVDAIVKTPPITQAGNIISIGHNFHQNNISIDYDIVTPRGTDLRADTGSGNVDVQQNGGPVQLKSGSGNIHGTGLSDHVALETGSGNIVADMLSDLDVKAQTGSGDITLNNVQGSLWAHTGSGSAKISGRPAGTWRLETGSGDISADVGNAAYTLDASTGSGAIAAADLTPSPGSTKDHTQGTVNGGGPRVRAMTGSGNIEIR